MTKTQIELFSSMLDVDGKIVQVERELRDIEYDYGVLEKKQVELEAQLAVLQQAKKLLTGVDR